MNSNIKDISLYKSVLLYGKQQTGGELYRGKSERMRATRTEKRERE